MNDPNVIEVVSGVSWQLPSDDAVVAACAEGDAKLALHIFLQHFDYRDPTEGIRHDGAMAHLPVLSAWPWPVCEGMWQGASLQQQSAWWKVCTDCMCTGAVWEDCCVCGPRVKMLGEQCRAMAEVVHCQLIPKWTATALRNGHVNVARMFHWLHDDLGCYDQFDECKTLEDAMIEVACTDTGLTREQVLALCGENWWWGAGAVAAAEGRPLLSTDPHVTHVRMHWFYDAPERPTKTDKFGFKVHSWANMPIPSVALESVYYDSIDRTQSQYYSSRTSHLNDGMYSVTFAAECLRSRLSTRAEADLFDLTATDHRTSCNAHKRNGAGGRPTATSVADNLILSFGRFLPEKCTHVPVAALVRMRAIESLFSKGVVATRDVSFIMEYTLSKFERFADPRHKAMARRVAVQVKAFTYGRALVRLMATTPWRKIQNQPGPARVVWRALFHAARFVRRASHFAAAPDGSGYRRILQETMVGKVQE